MPRQHHNNRKWSPRVMGRYALIQIPGFVLLVLLMALVRDWFGVPFWVIGMIIGLWLAKDMLLYPLVWRAYDPDNGGSGDRLIGDLGVAREKLAPSGYIRIGGELWKAEVVKGGPVEKGGSVRVLGLRGLTLIVESEEDSRQQESAGINQESGGEKR